MRDPEVTLEHGGNVIRVSSHNNHDYTVYGDQAEDLMSIKLQDLAKAVISDSALNDRTSCGLMAAPDAPKEFAASICFWDDDVLPWDESPLIYLNLTEGEQFSTELFGVSQTPTDRDTVEIAAEYLLRQFGFENWEVDASPEGLASTFDDGIRSWYIKAFGSLSRHSVGDLYRLRRQLSRSIFFSEDDTLHPRLVVDMLERGQARDLIGLSESETLEAKESYGGKPKPVWKILLAQHVSGFANADKGGILIVGMATQRNVDKEDILSELTPLDVFSGRRQQWFDILNQQIFPPIDGLEIGAIREGDGEVMYILIPPQAEELKPFIVHGGIVEGETPSNTFSITRRRDDDYVPVDAISLHSTIVAGRAFIRSGLNRRNESGR